MNGTPLSTQTAPCAQYTHDQPWAPPPAASFSAIQYPDGRIVRNMLLEYELLLEAHGA